MKPLWKQKLEIQHTNVPDVYSRRGGYFTDLYFSLHDQYRIDNMVDSHMTTEEIEAHCRKFIEITVPYEFRLAVCTCYRPNRDSDNGSCGDCGLLERWKIRKCYHCGEHFIPSLFTHRESRGIYCWECMVDKHGAGPDDIPPTEIPMQEVQKLSDALDIDLDFSFESPFT